MMLIQIQFLPKSLIQDLGLSTFEPLADVVDHETLKQMRTLREQLAETLLDSGQGSKNGQRWKRLKYS